jgi:hypothetical protein
MTFPLKQVRRSMVLGSWWLLLPETTVDESTWSRRKLSNDLPNDP